MRFTEQHEMLRDTTRRFVETEINPFCDGWEDEGIFPAHAVMKKAGDLGLLGITKPEAYGGSALDYSYAMVSAEALGYARAGGVPLAMGVQTDMCTPALTRYGSEALKQEFLVPSIAGDLVGAIAVSEPHAGSDVSRIRTTARKDGDDYVINGGKLWTTSGIQADWLCALVNTDASAGAGHTNKSLIIIPTSTRGVERPGKLQKMGLRCSDTAQIHFEDVRVPQRHRIGEEGFGFRYQMEQFQEERLWVAANMVGTLQLALDETVAYTRERKVFGRSVLDNQVVHFRLAELSTELEALRALVYQATEDYVGGQDVTRRASMAKLKAGRLARELTDACLQYWGGMGFVEETIINRLYRDIRAASIGGGADEVMLQIICKLDGTLPKS